MKNPFESVKNFLGMNKKPGEQMEYEIRREQANIDKKLAAKEYRQKQISECAAALNDCRMTFNQTILHENALAADMRRHGLDATKQRIRVREAAIGIMVVDQALFELQSINSESELNNAMNKMGVALRQLQRVDNSTSAVSGSTERILRKWYPAYDQDIAETETQAPTVDIPEEIREKIDDSFVKNLMDGDSFEMAMLKSSLNTKESTSTRSSADDLFEQIASSGKHAKSSSENYDDVVSKYTDNF